jgi:hypothetical protein
MRLPLSEAIGSGAVLSRTGVSHPLRFTMLSAASRSLSNVKPPSQSIEGVDKLKSRNTAPQFEKYLDAIVGSTAINMRLALAA